MDYLGWNDALAGQFFRAENAGRRVFLYVTTELIDTVGATAGALSNFVDAIKAGPPGATRTGLCQRALQVADNWRLGNYDYPPYVGYLGAFVLAATLDGPFPVHAYYPRLNKLLGEPFDAGAPPSFNKMYELWSDLEQWSNVDKDGQLGTFAADIVGGWLHVGIPLAQTVLTEKERSGLPVFFANADFDPGAPPTDYEVKQALLATPPETLRPRTVALLESDDSGLEDLRSALVAVVIDDLRQWDGSVSETAETVVRQIPLRLCFQFDSVIGAAAFSLRCRVPDESLLDEVEVQEAGSERVFECSSLAMGWTSALADRESGEVLDASHLDWAAGVALYSPNQLIRLRLPALRVRIFVSGAQVGLPGYVEERRLTPNTALYVAAHESVSGAVEKWGTSECAGFRKVPVKSGLPPEWRLYRADAAVADSLIRTISPNVSFPTSLRLWLKGGIRLHSGSNHYFDFAPPRVEVAAARDYLIPACEGQPCNALLGEGLFLLPNGLPHNVPLRVTIESTAGTRQQRFFTLFDDFARTPNPTFAWFDTLGAYVSALEPTTARYSGALVRDGPAGIESFALPLLSHGAAATLLGRRPGEIALWPAEEYPSAWAPVWVVRSRRKAGHVLFCGGQIEECEPSSDVVGGKRQVDAWKEVIWYRRCRISSPETEELRSLWRRYQQVARDA